MSPAWQEDIQQQQQTTTTTTTTTTTSLFLTLNQPRFHGDEITWERDWEEDENIFSGSQNLVVNFLFFYFMFFPHTTESLE